MLRETLCFFKQLALDRILARRRPGVSDLMKIYL